MNFMPVNATRKEVSKDAETEETNKNGKNNNNRDEDLKINFALVLCI